MEFKGFCIFKIIFKILFKITLKIRIYQDFNKYKNEKTENYGININGCLVSSMNHFVKKLLPKTLHL